MRPGRITSDEPRLDARRKGTRDPWRSATAPASGATTSMRPICSLATARSTCSTLEYLAELTMAILSHLRSKDPTAGYVTDFPELVERLAPILRRASTDLRIVTNAGGLNPAACAARCGEILRTAGLGETADRSRHGRRRAGARFPNGSRRGSTCLTSRPVQPIATWSSRLVAANVYLGAQADRRGTASRVPARGDRPGRRCFADARPGGRPFRLALGRLDQARRAPRSPAT